MNDPTRSNVSFFQRYTPESFEYPGRRVLDGVPPGTSYWYVSSDYLDAMLNIGAECNGGKFVVAFLLYEPGKRPPTETIRRWLEFQCKEIHTRSFSNLEPIQPAPVVAADPDSTSHEVFLLYRLPADEDVDGDDRPAGDQYVWFWYDPDVSDCSIGRFYTIDTRDFVVARLREEFTQARAPGQPQAVSAVEVEVPFLRGWVKW